GQSAARHAGIRGPGGVRRTAGSMTWLRSALFAAALLIITPPYALLALATFPLPRMLRYKIISGWSRLVVCLAPALLGIRWRGGERLEQGFWIVVFPEGTRVRPGERRSYQLGGAWLAAASGAPIVPVAHNAGLLWPRNAFLKHPGTVTVRIGPSIDPANRDPKTLNQLAEAWIEEQQKALC